MKVGFISFHSFANPGGVKNHILGLSKEFEKKGIETKIIVPRRKIWEKYEKNIILLGTSIPLNVAGTQGDLVFNLNPLAIKKLLEREQFDVLHFHNFIAPSAIQILEKSDSLNIITSHANVEAMPLIKKMIGGLNNSINRKVSGVIGVAPFNLDLFDKFEGPKEVIPNGVDLLEFNPSIKRLNKFDQKKINILFLGRIEERKGLIYLLKAYKILKRKYNNIRLIIVGDGTDMSHLQNLVYSLGVEGNVYFMGTQLGEDLINFHRAATVFASASPTETQGIVFLEAAACGKPVIGVDVGAVKEICQDNINGFLCETDNDDQISESMLKILQDKKLADKFSKASLEIIKQHDLNFTLDKFEEIYKFVIEKKQKESDQKILNKLVSKLKFKKKK